MHLGHSNIVKFKGYDGQRIRPFNDIEEHDTVLLNNFNALVKPEDRVYFLGDLAIGRKHLIKLKDFNGRKKLIKGNHDIFKLADYVPYFEDIVSYRIYPEHGIICSHIPVHEGQMQGRWKYNIHGHMHSNLVMKRAWYGKKIPDNRYINLCPEHTFFKPVDLDVLLTKLGLKNKQQKENKNV